MSHTFYPRYTMPAVPMGDKNQIRFFPPHQQYYTATKNVDLIWQILRESTGHKSLSQIIDDLVQENPGTSSQEITEIMHNLVSLGAIVDSRAVYKSFHPYTKNPMPFTHSLTIEEMQAHERSPHLPVHEGKVFNIEQGDSSLAQALANRKSCRSFQKKPLSRQMLGRILVSAYSRILHTTPSAGSLYPLKIYAIVIHADKTLPSGYYEYDPSRHSLSLYNSIVDYSQLQYGFNSESLLYNAPVILVVAADLQRHTAKYSNRGYRFTLLEAGHTAQNITALASESGMATLEYGGFFDDVVAEELDMPERGLARVQPLITLALGFASKKPRDEKNESLLETLKQELFGEDKIVNKLDIVRGLDSKPGSGNDFSGFVARAISDYADKRERKMVSGGAAPSTTLAQIKALAEAYERYVSGVIRVDRIASAQELSAQHEEWLNPQTIAPLTKEQYAKLDYLEPFDETATWQWIKAKRLPEGTPLWVPVDLAFYPVHAEQWNRNACTTVSSSGVAAHTSGAESIKRGLLELIERHALMTHWYQHIGAPRIPIQLLPNHWQKRIAVWQKQGFTTHVLDYSTNGVVVLAVLITSTVHPALSSGAAASIESFEEALAKAFSEAELSVSAEKKKPAAEPLTPEAVQSPGDHGDFYTIPSNAQKIAWLWKGPYAKTLPKAKSSLPELLQKYKPVVIQLSPKDGPLVVTRVLSEQLVPIHFGYGGSHHTHTSIDQQTIDPVSLSLPHYFA